MLSLEIISNRGFMKYFVWDSVYEREDILALELNAKIRKRVLFSIFIRGIFFLTSKLRLKVDQNKIFEFIDDIYVRYCIKSESLKLRIDMYPRSKSYLGDRKTNIIPYIQDFDKNVSLKQFEEVYAGHKLVLLLCPNHYSYLLKNNCGLNFKFHPHSISDKYILDRTTYFRKRKYDLMLPGRPNPTILNWLKKFIIKNPNFEYFSYDNIDNRNVYVSNKGNIIDCRSRKNYFQLLKDCNIAVYSTQGVDGVKNSLDHITPTLFEAISAGCLMIGMYTETDDSKYFKVDQICPAIFDYEKFSHKIKELIYTKRNNIDFNKSVNYLNKNKTSQRAELLSKKIDEVF